MNLMDNDPELFWANLKNLDKNTEYFS